MDEAALLAEELDENVKSAHAELNKENITVAQNFVKRAQKTYHFLRVEIRCLEGLPARAYELKTKEFGSLLTKVKDRLVSVRESIPHNSPRRQACVFALFVTASSSGSYLLPPVVWHCQAMMARDPPIDCDLTQLAYPHKPRPVSAVSVADFVASPGAYRPFAGPPIVLCSGWMAKFSIGRSTLGALFPNWKRRYFVLRHSELAYSSDETEMDAKGRIQLHIGTPHRARLLPSTTAEHKECKNGETDLVLLFFDQSTDEEVANAV